LGNFVDENSGGFSDSQFFGREALGALEKARDLGSQLREASDSGRKGLGEHL
jgi:hypothetical protein